MKLSISIATTNIGSKQTQFFVEAPSINKYLAQEQMALRSEECFSSFVISEQQQGKVLIAEKLPWKEQNEPGEIRIYIVKEA